MRSDAGPTPAPRVPRWSLPHDGMRWRTMKTRTRPCLLTPAAISARRVVNRPRTPPTCQGRRGGPLIYTSAHRA